MKSKKVTVPFNIVGHTAGDKVDYLELMKKIDIFVSQLLDENASLEEQLCEMETAVDELKDRVVQLEDQIDSMPRRRRYYQEYADYGVSPDDF